MIARLCVEDDPALWRTMRRGCVGGRRGSRIPRGNIALVSLRRFNLPRNKANCLTRARPAWPLGLSFPVRSLLEAAMENNDLKSMATHELLELYEKVGAKLARELAVEKARLQERLRKIESVSNV